MIKIVYLLLTLTFFFALPASGDSVPRMDKDQLKAMLGSETLVILDVRRGKDWSASEFKITGAVRSDEAVATVVGNYGKDQIFVLYCT